MGRCEMEWQISGIDQARMEQFAEDAGIGRIFAGLLLQRDIVDKQAVKRFIWPDIRLLHDPFLLNDMEQAVDRIRKARERGEHVTVYGDYDVDGVTSTAVILQCLHSLGVDADFYIPHRVEEGYGIHKEAVDEIQKRGSTLIVTVDTGITALDEVAYAKTLGIDCIVTDHHQPFEALPQAVAVINPARADSSYPFSSLAGVGVAFKLVCALLREHDIKSVLGQYIDLVCLGTISDVVPLIGENRIFAKFGLKILNKTNNIGIKALLKLSGAKSVNSTTVGFMLGPRINAAGRMERAEEALRLLLAESTEQAERQAHLLCEINQKRQQTELMILQQAIEMMGHDFDDRKVIVLAHTDWHQGVIGIVASKLLDRYHKPVILLRVEDGIAHGSARSIPGFHMFDALCECEELLERFGGHELAAGLTIREENIAPFTVLINEIADIVISPGALLPTLAVNMVLKPEEVTLELAEKLGFFEPFGAGNPTPVFAMYELEVTESKPTRDGKHLRLTVKKRGLYFSCIGFGMGDAEISTGDWIDIAFELSINEYNNIRNLNLVLKDIKK